MPNSLRAKLSKLRYKGEITQEEYTELIKKLDGHDKQTKYELLDNIGEYLFNSKYASEKIADLDYDQTVTFSKLEWMTIIEELYHVFN